MNLNVGMYMKMVFIGTPNKRSLGETGELTESKSVRLTPPDESSSNATGKQIVYSVAKNVQTYPRC
jgi:hypothetical protein